MEDHGTGGESATATKGKPPLDFFQEGVYNAFRRVADLNRMHHTQTMALDNAGVNHSRYRVISF